MVQSELPPFPRRVGFQMHVHRSPALRSIPCWRWASCASPPAVAFANEDHLHITYSSQHNAERGAFAYTLTSSTVNGRNQWAHNGYGNCWDPNSDSLYWRMTVERKPIWKKRMSWVLFWSSCSWLCLCGVCTVALSDVGKAGWSCRRFHRRGFGGSHSSSQRKALYRLSRCIVYLLCMIIGERNWYSRHWDCGQRVLLEAVGGKTEECEGEWRGNMWVDTGIVFCFTGIGAYCGCGRSCASGWALSRAWSWWSSSPWEWSFTSSPSPRSLSPT